MTEQEIRAEVAKRKWYQRIELPYGISTTGVRGVEQWEDYGLPKRLDGMSVLDVGAWEGAWSFEACRRGAKQVVAIDVWEKNNPGSLGAGLSNFELAQGLLGTNIEIHRRSVYDLSQEHRRFDLVLFLQVLYHLQDPLLALRKLRSVADGLVCLETWLDALWIDEPAAIFYPGKELNDDKTNWWGPNEACVHGMAKAAGFESKLVWSEEDPAHFGGRGKRGCFHLK